MKEENTWTSKLYALAVKFVKSEFFRYLLFGVLTTVVGVGSYFAFSEALSVNGEISTLGVLIANQFSWVLAVLFAYITNKLFVFRARSFKRSVLFREMAGFFAARVFSLVVEDAWLWAAVGFGMNDKLAKVLGQVIVVIINYVFSKLFIFKKEKQNEK